jgi:hypothetical protein
VPLAKITWNKPGGFSAKVLEAGQASLGTQGEDKLLHRGNHEISVRINTYIINGALQDAVNRSIKSD